MPVAQQTFSTYTTDIIGIFGLHIILIKALLLECSFEYTVVKLKSLKNKK